MSWESELQGLESSLRNLNAQYDAFLYGSSLKPPVEIRRRVGQQIRQLSATEAESSAVRFRFQALQVRYNALCERWDRLQSEKESGRRPGIYSHFVRLGGRRQAPPLNVGRCRWCKRLKKASIRSPGTARTRSALFFSDRSRRDAPRARMSPARDSTSSSRSSRSSAGI
jgi:hypothetical protein